MDATMAWTCMMRRRRLLRALAFVALAAIAAVAWFRWSQYEEKYIRAEGIREPLLQDLVQERAKNDADHKSRFFVTLSALAKKNGNSLNDYFHPFCWVSDGYAVRIANGGDVPVVAILRGDSCFIPGDNTQYLLAFDGDGRIVDTLSCNISNRLSGAFRTDVTTVPNVAGAQLVIRYIPEAGGSLSASWEHDWEHWVTHRGKSHRFRWDQKGPEGIRSTELDRNGLCGIAVRKGGFVIVFPSMPVIRMPTWMPTRFLP